MTPKRTSSITKEDVIDKTLKITSDELKEFDISLLKPRFHLDSLEYLIEMDAFEDTTQAISIKDGLVETQVASTI